MPCQHLDQQRGRGLAAGPDSDRDASGVVGGNAYAITNAALNDQPRPPAGGQRGDRQPLPPESVDTSMQAWIRGQSPEKMRTALHERLARELAPPVSGRHLQSP